VGGGSEKNGKWAEVCPNNIRKEKKEDWKGCMGRWLDEEKLGKAKNPGKGRRFCKKNARRLRDESIGKIPVDEQDKAGGGGGGEGKRKKKKVSRNERSKDKWNSLPRKS